MTYRRSKPSTQSKTTVRALNGQGMLTEYRELFVPKKFCLGTGHVTFFLDKAQFTLDRYKQIHEECIRRGFNVPDYSENWEQVLMKDYWNSYVPTEDEKELLIQRISERIQGSSKTFFHYEGKSITKGEAIEILTNKSL